MDPDQDAPGGADSDSDSDEDVPVNIVGDIPLEWYDEFDHIGWTSTGEKVIPKERPNALDEIIRRSTDPDWWRRIYDKYAGEYRTLTSDDLDLIDRIRTGRVALHDFQLYQPFRETPDPVHKIHPVTNFIRRKGGFVPSKATLYRVQQFIAEIRRPPTPTRRRTSTYGRHLSRSSRSAADDQ
jgi:ribosome biogenesis protein ERB1